MKKLILFFLFSFAVLGSQAQFETKTPFLVKTFDKAQVKQVLAETSGGSVHVTGSDGVDIKVEVFVQSGNGRLMGLSKEEIQKRMDENYELTITLSDNQLTVKAKPRGDDIDWKRSLSISFNILVPRNVSTNLSTSGGSISLNSLSGTQDFRTSGGSLHVEDLSGKIKGRTSGGSIHIKNSRDNIDLGTSGGSISAANCTGTIQLETSGGSLTLDDLKGTITATTSGGSVHGGTIGGELSTHTSGGSITLRDLSCSLDASTSGGHIDAEIKELGSYVKLRNSGGHISLTIPKDKGLDLKLFGNIKAGKLEKFSGTVEKSKIEGTLNGGGIPVTVDAQGGKLILSFN
ncbi:DUF4097 family beta strand repeat-containing protein [Flavitalea flava]